MIPNFWKMLTLMFLHVKSFQIVYCKTTKRVFVVRNVEKIMAVDSTRLPYLSTSFQLDYFNIQSLKYVSIFEWNIWNFTSLTCLYFIFVAKAYRRFFNHEQRSCRGSRNYFFLLCYFSSITHVQYRIASFCNSKLC